MKFPRSSLPLFALLLALQARAEPLLFPTDVLPAGAADVLGSWSQARYSFDAFSPVGSKIHQTNSAANQQVQFRYGLGHDWHFGVAASHNSETETRVELAGGKHWERSRSLGQGNPSLWVKHAFALGEQSPFSLAASLRTTPNTTGMVDGRDSVELAGGWDFGSGLKAYCSYEATIPHSGRLSPSHTLAAGIFKPVADGVTLVPRLRHLWQSDGERLNGYRHYGGSLEAHVRLADNAYLIPEAGWSRATSTSDLDGLGRLGARTGRELAMSIYFSF